jgi:protein-disulfide isomerase
MPDKKSIFGDNPKTTFLLGLFVGIAIFSTISASVFTIAFFTGKGFNTQPGEEAAQVAAAPTDQPAEEPTTVVEEVPAVSSEDYIKGPENAKITLIEYSDFECPYCTGFKDTLEQILDEYGDDVRLVVRHFPLSFHANSKSAALATECAGEQGKFWEMHDKIFEANVNDNMGVDTWKKAAQDLGLNTKNFNDCLDNEKYADKITEQMQDGMKAGVKGTPATFVNGEMVSGALPYETFQQIIEQILAE